MGSALPLRRSQHLWIRRDSSDFLVAYPLERIIVVTITMSGKPVTTFWRMAGMSYLQVRKRGNIEYQSKKWIGKEIVIQATLPAIARINTAIAVAPLESTNEQNARNLSLFSCCKLTLLLSLQYVNKAATSMRGALKEPAQRKAMEQEAFAYKVSTWQDGKQSPKVPVDVLAQSGATS
jgi:hypothetical protein